MLLRLKKDTGMRYLRFNGIFSDRLFVAAADASGNPVYNFAYVDMVLDFLHSIALKPWIQLSFMPRVLALHPNKYLFNDNVSQPRVKNILDNYDRLSSYGFWSLTDLMFDAPIPELPFFGGGPFTRKGIPKASYFLPAGKAWLRSREKRRRLFMTEENGTYQILMYNYQHFSTLYANEEKFDMTRTDRYTVFANKEPKILHVRIENCPQGTWRIRETYINRDAGSVFDAWVRSGSPDILTEDEELYLRNAAAPGYCERIASAAEDGVLCFDEKLELLEIRLAVIEAMTRDNR